MLPRQNRLPSYEIVHVQKIGKKIYLGEFSLSLTPTKVSIPRFAFIVSTRVSKLAVRRNRIRRLLSESVWQMIDEIKPADIVMTVRKDFSQHSQPEIKLLVKSVLQNLGILK
jgi:ribonuclease P protein component